MRDDVLDERQRAALRALTPAAQRGYYLAGGTALCLHLRHRVSVDLDLFRTESFDAEAMVADLDPAPSAIVASCHVAVREELLHRRGEAHLERRLGVYLDGGEVGARVSSP
jgi:hypothetical protein